MARHHDYYCDVENPDKQKSSNIPPHPPSNMKMSKPANAIDILADSASVTRGFRSNPMCSYFNPMTAPASMPQELTPFMARSEYVAKLTEMNDKIAKWEEYWDSRVCGCCRFLPCFTIPMKRKAKRVMVAGLKEEARRIFAEWVLDEGIDEVIFIPAETPNVPNVIRVILPVEESMLEEVALVCSPTVVDSARIVTFD